MFLLSFICIACPECFLHLLIRLREKAIFSSSFLEYEGLVNFRLIIGAKVFFPVALTRQGIQRLGLDFCSIG